MATLPLAKATTPHNHLNLLTTAKHLLQTQELPTHLLPNYTYPPAHTRNVYNRHDAGPLIQSNSAKSSVLVPLTQHNNQLYVVLTRRTSKMRKHAGQIALPGGKNERSDLNDYHAAMREANEEIHFPYPNAQNPLQYLVKGTNLRYTPTNETITVLDYVIEATAPHYVTIQMPDGREKQTTTERLSVLGVDYICDLERLCQPAFDPPLVVTPVVVAMDYDLIYDQLIPNEDECDAVFLAPLKMFVSNGDHHSVFDFKHHSGNYRMHHFNVPWRQACFDVWGMTADILIHLSSLVYSTRPQFSMNSKEDVSMGKAQLFAGVKRPGGAKASKL
jgi:hypothetical protein